MSRSLLYVENVTVDFDGFKALRDLNFIMDEGELRVVIGPNGAGKTTLLDVISGKVKPSAGRVVFGRDAELSTLAEHEIARAGIGRMFQTPTIYPSLTVFENLELSQARGRGVLAGLFARLSSSQRQAIAATLERVGLENKGEWRAAALSHGEKQWLELAMLMVHDPELYLVDEPVAGMSGEETDRTAEILLDIAKRRSVLVIEHDMAFVRRLGAKVTVLHEGQQLCEGSMEEVQRNQRVVEVYLGRERKGKASAAG
ncbi:MAG TPA: urea ABC transporter ATP-binding protein UrtD [Nitrospiria bacterium]|nr:urea ABC transporter ATP-binding protein UrtD [Nitrospiria bacterium]